MAPLIPFAPSVNTNSAPYAAKSFLRSTLIVSGSVSIALYPLATATNAKPIPVLPEVGSIIVAPGLSIPFFSASSIIDNATLSFADPAGLRYSSLANIFLSVYLFSFSIGVFPISSVTLLTTIYSSNLYIIVCPLITSLNCADNLSAALRQRIILLRKISK